MVKTSDLDLLLANVFDNAQSGLRDVLEKHDRSSDAPSGTAVVRTSPGLATASLPNASSLMVVESSVAGPHGRSDAGRSEVSFDRLVREMVDTWWQGGES